MNTVFDSEAVSKRHGRGCVTDRNPNQVGPAPDNRYSVVGSSQTHILAVSFLANIEPDTCCTGAL
jgi:hypothetical protein